MVKRKKDMAYTTFKNQEQFQAKESLDDGKIE